MKKTLAFVLTAVMSLSLLAGCGSKTAAPDNTNNDQPQQQVEEKLSGSVSTNGSTSMERVIGALSEQFMADNSGVSVTYDPPAPAPALRPPATAAPTSVLPPVSSRTRRRPAA